MALKLTVKPGESFFVGTAEITVQCDTIVSVLVGGKAPVLRSEDYIPESEANTPIGRLQLAVQQMYLSGDVSGHHVAYFEAVQALLATAPQHAPLIAEVNRMLMDGASYKAIKLLKCISNPELTENRARLKLVS
jgi:flagellar biosynthesis regulator FlbT